MSQIRDLELLIESKYPVIAVETEEEDRLYDMLRRLTIHMNIQLYMWTPVDGLTRPPFKDTLAPDDRQPLQALAQVAAGRDDGIYLFKDLHKYLDDPAVLRRVRDLAPALARGRRALILTGPHMNLPAEIRAIAAPFKLDLPTPEELKVLVHTTAKDLVVKRSAKVQLTVDDMERLALALRGLTLFEAERALTRAIMEDMALTRADLERVIQIKKEIIERDCLLDFWPRLDDLAAVGGLKNLKAWLEKRRRAFTPEAQQFGIEPPKGILLLGVQGCGKSLCAKAVAKEWELPLLKMEPGRLYDKFVGESEKNLERALDVAARLAPAVLWIDEIEKGFASVNQSETDAGLSKRIFGRLLAWLQDRPAPVFVAATCNDILSLPPEMMRKGRFDEIFFVDLPNPEERALILTIHLKKRKRDPAAFDLPRLAAACDGFSGAEIEQAIVSALYAAFSAGSDLTTDILLQEMKSTHPLSVVRAEEVSSLREWAASRTVPAS